MKRRTYKITVKDGKGLDRFGIERDFSEYLQNGTITVSIPRDKREYTRYDIKDADTGEEWDVDFGKVQGRNVIPIRVKVYFGKADYVECGYTMRRDGSYYYGENTHFRSGHNKAYDKSLFKELHERTLGCPDAHSCKYGWLLPDETKDAIEAELKEATSGKYRFEIVFDQL